MDTLRTILDHAKAFFDQIGAVIWGWPEWPMPLLAICLLGTGMFLTLRLRFINVRGFVHAIRIVKGDYDDPDDPGDISHFQALSTALSATVGVGNIAGVATAIHYGGPGALFWMWVTAAFGMTTKYTECTLAMRYRKENVDGTVSGGPMYYIEQGIGSRWKPLAIFFACCATISSFGSGNAVQAHTMADAMHSAFGVPTWITGSASAVVVALVILGGIHRIGNFTSRVVPLMAVVYFIGAVVILAINYRSLPQAFATIILDAWRPTAAVGGFAGATFLFTLTWGIKRGLFSNEAGQGSAPIAHAAARTDEPVREGSVALLEPFIDTLTICTLTGLVIVSTGVWQKKLEVTLPFNAQSQLTIVKESCTIGLDAKAARACAIAPGAKLAVAEGRIAGARIIGNHGFIDSAVLQRAGAEAAPFTGSVVLHGKGPRFFDAAGKPSDVQLHGRALQNGGPLTAWAFDVGLSAIFPFGRHLVAICVLLFALSTAIGWSYYGGRGTHYLLRQRALLPYKLLFVGMNFVGAIVPLEVVWSFGDAALGMMSLPNLFAILVLSGQVSRMTREYYSREHVPSARKK